MNTPVVLIVFNRPNHVRRVLERVAEARPPKLFVIADGPRNAEEKELCAQVRSIATDISWPAEVYTNFSDINLKGLRRIPSGLDWVFARVPEAIILEDDCLPGPDFFPFCEEMLERYRNDSRIGVISGDNFASGMRCPDSYYFSKYPFAWGWATWRRTWSLFDMDLRSWSKTRSRGLLDSVFANPETIAFWTSSFDRIYSSPLGWDAKLVYACLTNNLLNVLPAENLVSNIGWDAEASHTHDTASPLANIPIGKLSFPLRHPDRVVCWTEADEAAEELIPFRLPQSREAFATNEASRPLSSFGQRLTTTTDNLHLKAKQQVNIPIRIENPGPETWDSTGEFPVNISYKWLNGGATPLPIEGERTPLPAPIMPGKAANVHVRVIAPDQPGRFALRITAVQEGVAWFMTESGTFLELSVTVV